MNKSAKMFVTGHEGVFASALVRRLQDMMNESNLIHGAHLHYAQLATYCVYLGGQELAAVPVPVRSAGGSAQDFRELVS